MYEVLERKKTAQKGGGSIGCLIEDYFLGETPFVVIPEKIQENICPVSAECENTIKDALQVFALEYYTVSEWKQPDVIAAAVRQVIQLL